MEELNTLDLLKSLTLGVNNKINQEQDSEIEYIVDTSSSNKKKKSAPPIVKEVVKEKKLDNISDDFLDTEDFYESEIIEEPFDTIVENDIFVEECEEPRKKSFRGLLHKCHPCRYPAKSQRRFSQ